MFSSKSAPQLPSEPESLAAGCRRSSMLVNNLASILSLTIKVLRRVTINASDSTILLAPYIGHPGVTS